jgi:hypothetical protein
LPARLITPKQVYANYFAGDDHVLARSHEFIAAVLAGLDVHPRSMLEVPAGFFDLTQEVSAR